MCDGVDEVEPEKCKGAEKVEPDAHVIVQKRLNLMRM